MKLFGGRYVAAVGAGALLACAYAPLGWWPLGVLCPAVLIGLWQGQTPRRAAWLGFWFNAATFAAGTYWLYISIHLFGQAPVWLAVFLMISLVAIMGLYHALAAHDRAGPLAAGDSGRLGAHRVVARLVSVGVPMAVIGLFTN